MVGDALSVEAKHEEKSDNKFVSRQFSRKYTLPKGCDASMVSSNLSSDGILASWRLAHKIMPNKRSRGHDLDYQSKSWKSDVSDVLST